MEGASGTLAGFLWRHCARPSRPWWGDVCSGHRWWCGRPARRCGRGGVAGGALGGREGGRCQVSTGEGAHGTPLACRRGHSRAVPVTARRVHARVVLEGPGARRDPPFRPLGAVGARSSRAGMGEDGVICPVWDTSRAVGNHRPMVACPTPTAPAILRRLHPRRRSSIARDCFCSRLICRRWQFSDTAMSAALSSSQSSTWRT